MNYYSRRMTTIQIRDVDPRTTEVMKERAAQASLSLSEYLRRQLDELAGRPTMSEFLAGIHDREMHPEIDPVAELTAARHEHRA